MTEIRVRSVACTKCKDQRDVDASEFMEHYSKVHLNINMFKCVGCEKTFATPFYASLHPCKSKNKKIELILDLSSEDAKCRLLALQKGYNDAMRHHMEQYNEIFISHFNSGMADAKKAGAAEYAASLKQKSSRDQGKEDAKRGDSKSKTTTFKKPASKAVPEAKKKPPAEEEEEMEPVSFTYGGRDEPKAKKAKIDVTVRIPEKTPESLMQSLSSEGRHMLEAIAKKSANTPQGSSQPTGNKKQSEGNQAKNGDFQVHIGAEEASRDGVLYVSQNTQQPKVTVTIADKYPHDKDNRGPPLKQCLTDRVSFPNGRNL